jgi:glycosyltransferase involved in cell wall biosynthesis
VLNMTDILVISSRWESVPKILLEAMWCRKAIVAARVGDIEEILDPTCGMFVRSDAPEDIAEAVIRLGQDATLRDQLGAAAHEKIERMGLTLERSITRYDRIYRHLAQHDDRRGSAGPPV